MKNKKFNPLFHLIVLALAVALNKPHALDINSLICYAMTLAFPLAIFYLCYYWLMPHYEEQKRTFTFIVWLLVLLNLATPIAFFSLIMTLDSLSGSTIHLFYRLDMHLSGLAVLSIAAFFGIAFRLARRWYITIGSQQVKRLWNSWK